MLPYYSDSKTDAQSDNSERLCDTNPPDGVPTDAKHRAETGQCLEVVRLFFGKGGKKGCLEGKWHERPLAGKGKSDCAGFYTRNSVLVG